MRASHRVWILSILLINTLAAACGSQTPTASTPTEPLTATPAQTPPTATAESAPPKTLRIRYWREPKTLEAGLSRDLITSWVSKDLHAGLLRFDDKMLPSPSIARDWEISPDGLTYTFYLRDDVTFHNGRRVTAEDFVYTFSRDLDPRVKSDVGPQNLDKVKGAKDFMAGRATRAEGLEALDDTTLKIVLAEPDPTLLLRLSAVYMSVIPREAVVEGEARWKDQPVGAGAFRFVEWQPGTKIVLEANPDYFLGRPRLDRIEGIIVPDPAAALAMYQAGELDVVDVSGSLLAQARQDPSLSQELSTWPRAQLTWFGLNQKKVPAFQDKRVRQAFIYAINRNSLIEEIMLGQSFLATGYVPAGIPEAVPGEKAYPYDPAKAQDLLAQAGFPGGQDFPKIEFVSTADETLLLETIAAQLKANLGVEVTVRIEAGGDILNGMWAKDRWDMWSWAWSADRPTAEVWLYELMYSTTDSNFVSYSNPVYDRLVDQARAESAPGKRAAAWQEVERMAYEEAPYIPLGFTKFIYLVKPHVRAFSVALFGPTRFETVDIAR